jgi:hypothetical protein
MRRQRKVLSGRHTGSGCAGSGRAVPASTARRGVRFAPTRQAAHGRRHHGRRWPDDDEPGLEHVIRVPLRTDRRTRADDGCDCGCNHASRRDPGPDRPRPRRYGGLRRRRTRRGWGTDRRRVLPAGTTGPAAATQPEANSHLAVADRPNSAPSPARPQPRNLRAIPASPSLTARTPPRAARPQPHAPKATPTPPSLTARTPGDTSPGPSHAPRDSIRCRPCR